MTSKDPFCIVFTSKPLPRLDLLVLHQSAVAETKESRYVGVKTLGETCLNYQTDSVKSSKPTFDVPGGLCVGSSLSDRMESWGQSSSKIKKCFVLSILS